jgi:hypothetical protein
MRVEKGERVGGDKRRFYSLRINSKAPVLMYSTLFVHIPTPTHKVVQ